MSLLSCELAGKCGGCPLILQPYSEQISQKTNRLKQIWSEVLPETQLPEIHLLSLGLGGLRDRTDLTWTKELTKELKKESANEPAVKPGASAVVGKYGLYNFEHTEIVDMKVCPQMSPELQKLFKKIQEVQFPVELGSLRLRVGPSAQWGIWLDFSNERIKALLDEKLTLRKLLSFAHVEIGQKRKFLVDDGEKLKLEDPMPKAWFQTYLGVEAKPTNLLCSIADFTQPSMQANKVLISEIMAPLRKAGVKNGVEFGSGVGNFTLPFAYEFSFVDAFELDQRACFNLQDNLTAHNLSDKVQIHRGNFHKESSMQEFMWAEKDFIFIDPPRSGMQGFLKGLENVSALDRPKHLVYVSCFAESFVQDSSVLSKLGYNIESIKILDQFPQSYHMEIIAYFRQE